MKTTYKARKGAPFSNKDAPVIGKTLKGIFNKYGHVTPEEIVEEAKPEKSPIHKHFEWNDKKAGKLHRLYQARQLTNHLMEVIYTEGKKGKTEEIHIKAYENTFDDKGKRAYKPIRVIIENDSDRKQLIDRIISNIEYLNNLMKLLRAYEK